MRPIKRLIALAIVGLSVSAAVRAEEPPFPTPPQQNAPWTPPETKLPRFMVTAAQALFEQGLADPRGCEYRSIRIQVGDAQGGRMEISTTGWVLPAAEGGKPRFAVAWSGLVYPLAGLGKPADLDADVASPQRGERRVIAPGRMMQVDFRRRGIEIVDEAAAIGLDTFHPIQVCLLLRLDRADLAETLWTRAGKPLAPKAAGLDLRSYGVSYLTLAADYARFLNGRAIREHLSGEDALALADARALVAFGRAVDAKAAELGFLPSRPYDGLPWAKREVVFQYLGILDQAPVLLADQERRARERVAPPPPAPEGDKATPLIRALDQMTATPQGQGGFINGGIQGGPNGDPPAIKALVDLGDEAVEPLIRDLRSDNRLTRSLDFGGFRGPTIMRVDRAVYLALTRILEFSSLGPLTMRENSGEPVDPNALADRLEKYWDKNKGLPMTERWRRTLADDQAGVAAWLEAAGSIVRPENVGGAGAGAFVAGLARVDPAQKPKLQGEPLREAHSPTVTELLIRRIESIRKAAEHPALGVNQSMQMAGYLAAWDAEAAAPALRDMAKSYRDLYAQAKPGSGVVDGRNLAMTIARLTTLRAKAGDPSALDEYAEWIRTIHTLDPQDPSLQAILEPVRNHPQNPKLAASADWLFNDPQSPWAASLNQKGGRAVTRLAWMITTPLMEIPAFRKMVRTTAMADREAVGKAEVRDGGQVNIQFEDGSSMGGTTSRDQNDPDAPPIGAKADVRACDVYAWRLATRGDAPYFNPCWPEPKRDAALEKMVEFLKP